MELFKIQEDLRLQLNKVKVNFRKCSKERLTKQYVETRLQQIEEKWIDFTKNHYQILKCKEDYSKSPYFVNDIFNETEEFYLDFKSELKYVLDKFSQSIPLASSSKDSVYSSNHNKVKLPKITIPTFSGKYTEWPSFRDLFVSLIHNNGSLDKVQKMHYLKSHLSGEAEQLLRHVPVTSDNYEECWFNLQERYNNKKYLSNCLLKRFFNQTNILTESSFAIKELMDTSVDTLNGIKHLGIDITSWDVIVIYVMCSKLDNESRKLWESKISSSPDLPKFSEFKEFLESRFRSLEFLDTKSKTNKTSFNFKPKVHHVINAIESSSQTKRITCPFCHGDHKISHCKEFAKVDVDTRRNFIQSSGLCFNCFGTNHVIKYCRLNVRCRVCKKKHHSLLHAKSVSTLASSYTEPKPVAGVSASVSNKETLVEGEANYSPINTYFSKENIRTEVLLATAVIKVEARNKYYQHLRALIDQGSQASFITEAAVQLLGLKKIPSINVITGLGKETSSVTSKFIVSFKMQSLYNPSFTTQVTAYVLSKLTSFLPSKELKNYSWPKIETLQLADPDFGRPNKIDILLGAEIYGQIVEEGLIKGPPGAPIAQKTSLGWILSGQIQPKLDQIHCHHIAISVDAYNNDNELIRKFWEIESDYSHIDKKQLLSDEEKRCQEFYKNTTSRDTSGRYIVKLPFREDDPKCKYGQSEQIATKRFYLLEKRLSKDPDLKSEYTRVIHEYLNLNHMQKVAAEEQGKGVYLPHHAVVRNDKTTTKVRVVFDASCRGSNGISLNNDLMVGPTLQPDLRTIIMRWRRHPICLTSDIVKMYRQIMVEKSDTEFQRIVWRDSPNDELQHFKLSRVTFGTASAPYLAVRTLHQVAYDEGGKYRMAAGRVIEDFYMDDLMTGHETVSDAFQLYQEMNALLKLGGFELQKWSSNNKELLNKMSEEKNKETKNLEIKCEPVLKILGLIWNTEKDQFEYSVQLPNLSKPITKRKVISDICRLFDPLGWIAPTIVIAKIMIQKIWISGVGWDDPLPASLLAEWFTYRSNLLQLTGFTLPRWIHTKSKNKLVELHGFGDASNDAYAAVVYIRVLDCDNTVHVNLVTSKTKVAPVKQITTPRLELCGAVLTAKLLKEVGETLSIPRENIHAWTDSSVVLAWISSHPCKWQTFVANRVSNILSIMDSSQWSHVRSKDNPADGASRGIKASDLINLKLWKEGPDWLKSKDIDYSRPKGIETRLEEKTKTVCHIGIVEEDKIWTRFSSLKRLKRVLSWVRRWLFVLHRVNSNNIERTPWLNSMELNDTLNNYIKYCQKQYFKEEIKELLKSNAVNKKSKLASLNPFLDTDNVLRVGGRLQRAEIPNNKRHPVLIPRESHLANLILSDAHECTLHGGTQLMLNYIRTKYWILDSRRLVKSFLRKCVICVRYSSTKRDQIMGQLPSSRVNPCRPFRQSGVDYAGPINIRTSKGRGHHASKGYICLFVCMATRAVHLEAVSDLTAQGFLAAFKRFVARRGICTDLWSDNGTNFVGAARELRTMFRNQRSERVRNIADWLGTNGTNWHFIPPYAPNFGGLWEAGIKSTKHHLKRVIGDTTLTFEEITTVLAQIEACLNSRPISQLSNNPDDPTPLTPGHFLVGEQLVLIADTCYEDSSISSLKRWQLTQRMVQSFWRKWSQEYLVQFLNRYKWNTQNPEPKIGDVVLVKEDDLPPSKWLYGIITDKHPGIDNVTRVVSLKSKGVIMKRPVSKLCILPVTE